MTYQKVTGPLMANSHPGSYCGQDAYNDMLVTNENHNDESQLYAHGRNCRRDGERTMCDGSQGSSDRDSNRGGDTDMANVVRRLTPLECERLQGYPDGWTDIGEYTDTNGKTRQTSDSARYKALGNSIALPFWEWLMKRIAAEYKEPATLGSLFDGIGGFPLAAERAGIEPVWASEIEEFPIAVTKRHFEEGEQR